MDISDNGPVRTSDLAIDSVEELLKQSPTDDDSSLPHKPNAVTEVIDDDSVSVQTGTDDLIPLGLDLETLPQEHMLGLDINDIRGWSGSEYDDYDVIAVHGIRDDYKTAWIDKKGDWILKEHLFKGMSIREIDYSYEIHDESVLYHQNGIDVLATELVDRYAEERKRLAETETDRPIIWVCHDVGGTIAKQALVIASKNHAKYGKIFMHTTGIVFIGTPHRFESPHDACDQIHKLILLPGPGIKRQVLMKVKHLAEQIDRINKRFATTKLLDRACIFHILSQSIIDSLAHKAEDDKFESSDGLNYKV